MKLTGIADEAGETVDAQIDATNALGWKHIEARFVKVDGFEKGSIHEIPEEALKLAAHKFKEAGIGICGIGSTIGNWAHSISGKNATRLSAATIRSQLSIHSNPPPTA